MGECRLVCWLVLVQCAFCTVKIALCIFFKLCGGVLIKLFLYCLNRAVLVPLLGTGLILYCLNRAVLVPLLDTGLILYCPNRAVLVP